MRDAARPLAFLHIPKTAGTSIQLYIRQALREPREVFAHSPLAFGAFDDFNTFAPDIQRIVARTPDHLPRDGEFLTGHLPLSYIQAAYPQAQIMTILREPVTRLISNWLYLRAFSETELSRWGAWAETLRVAKWSLHDFLSDARLASQTDNVYLRYLLWPNADLPLDDFLAADKGEALVASALEQLSAIHFVDCIENPSLTSRLSRWLASFESLPHVNATEAFDLASEMTPQTVDLLQARTRFDTPLWASVMRP